MCAYAGAPASSSFIILRSASLLLFRSCSNKMPRVIVIMAQVTPSPIPMPIGTASEIPSSEHVLFFGNVLEIGVSLHVVSLFVDVLETVVLLHVVSVLPAIPSTVPWGHVII